MSRQKPDPHNALLICEEMRTTPDRVVIVGDTVEDIALGLNAKVRICLVVCNDISLAFNVKICPCLAYIGTPACHKMIYSDRKRSLLQEHNSNESFQDKLM